MLYPSDFNYCGFEINASVDESGNYWINSRTLENLFGWDDKRTQQNLNRKKFLVKTHEIRLLKNTGKIAESPITGEFQGTKFESILDYSYKQGHGKKRWYKASDFTLMVVVESYLTKDPEVKARLESIKDAAFVVDFMTTLKTHFGEVVTEEEKETIRTLIFHRLIAFRAWTSVIRDRHLELYGEKPTGDYYKKCVTTVNESLFGVKHFNCDRDNMTELQQATISEFEQLMVKIARKNKAFDPEGIIEKALFCYHLIN